MNVSRFALALIGAAVFLGAPLNTHAAEPSPTATAATKLPTVAELTRKLNNLFRAKSSQTTMTMKVSTKNFSRELKLESWSKGEDDSVVVIRSPSREAGTATLRTKKGLWNYAPRADRMMRIPNSMLAGSWMGSHFTNEDLMRETDYTKDYRSTVAWDTVDGTKAIKLTMIPNKKTATVYTKMVYWVRAADYLPIKTDFFDGSKVVKRMVYSAYKRLGGKLLPTRMVIVPTNKPKESTTVIYNDAKFNVKVDASTFTPSGIRRLARQG